ncbi:hypothetical protein AHF37_02378 [Paragonimus kellicotti]|nr:hypothetical protein AHF37_02378 [Paragonimus kellicotti]
MPVELIMASIEKAFSDPDRDSNESEFSTSVQVHSFQPGSFLVGHNFKLSSDLSHQLSEQLSVETDVSEGRMSPTYPGKCPDNSLKCRMKLFNPPSLIRPFGNTSNASDNSRKSVSVLPHDGKKFKISSRSSLKKQKPPDLSKELSECRDSQSPVLDLSNEELQQLPSGVFDDLTWLTELYLYENKLSSLPPSIGRLTNLRLLLVQQNLLAKLPKEMANLIKLEQLDLRHNRLEGSLPVCISSMFNLKNLLLKYNKLTCIKGIEKLKQLTCLVVCQNCLKQELPSAIGELTRLTTLDLSHNQLTSLPENIGDCRALRNLNLQHNQLERLPESMGNLVNLCKLSVKYNQLTEIPKSLSRCKELDEFNVENNQLSSLPDDLLCNLPKLKNITLSRNSFTSFPAGGPGQFRTCYSLNIDHNRISDIPSAIFTEANGLTRLNLCDNNITFLVPADSNELEALPEDLSGLVSLQELNVVCNRLTTFPKSIGSSSLEVHR